MGTKTTEQSFTEEFYKLLKARKESIVTAITKGGAENYADYKQLVGQLMEHDEIAQEYDNLVRVFFPVYD